MESITDVLFDLDGTLIDSLPGIEWSAREALAECSLDADLTDLRSRIGPPIRVILQSVSGMTGEMLNRLETAFRRSYDTAGWRRTELRPGVIHLLRELHDAGRRLWLITNKPSLATRQILAELKINGFFEECWSRDSRNPAFVSKAEMLDELLKRHHIRNVRAILVGDTIEDCRAAGAVGVQCFVVLGGYGNGCHAFEARDCCSTISDWHEILEFCETER